jgi:vacuolar-type H+-ATPase subunit E/Vma4
MSLEELVARLERDAEARVAAIEAKAREEIDAFESERARAASTRDAAELAKKRDARARASERVLSTARRRASSDVLRARHEVFDRAIARAAELLESANGDAAYRASLPARLEDALAHAQETGGAIVRCRADLADAVRTALGERAEVRVDEAVASGFVLEAADMMIDETLASRLARMRDALVMALAAEVRDD